MRLWSANLNILEIEMALITLRQLLDHAAEHDYGIPAFNVNNLEQVRAILEAADATDSPAIRRLRPAPGSTLAHTL